MCIIASVKHVNIFVCIYIVEFAYFYLCAYVLMQLSTFAYPHAYAFVYASGVGHMLLLQIKRLVDFDPITVEI